MIDPEQAREHVELVARAICAASYNVSRPDLVDNHWPLYQRATAAIAAMQPVIDTAVLAAIQTERERCADLVEVQWELGTGAFELASAIRAEPT